LPVVPGLEGSGTVVAAGKGLIPWALVLQDHFGGEIFKTRVGIS
jgi:NADPH:quinone reductase-like Zn-dependent oxidoreductase